MPHAKRRRENTMKHDQNSENEITRSTKQWNVCCHIDKLDEFSIFRLLYFPIFTESEKQFFRSAGTFPGSTLKKCHKHTKMKKRNSIDIRIQSWNFHFFPCVWVFVVSFFLCISREIHFNLILIRVSCALFSISQLKKKPFLVTCVL